MTKPHSTLIFGVEDRPNVPTSIFTAFQHILASFIGVITPTLIVGGVLGLGDYVPYLVSMALIVSGIGTFIQARKFGPVGSGLLCLQGTSFGFLSVILSGGMIVKARGGSPEEILATLYGCCFLGAFIEIAVSRFIHKLKRIVTPVVTGTIITLMGLSLVKVAMTDMAGGFGASDLGSIENIGLAALVLGIIVVLNRFNLQFLRMSAIFIGLLVGFAVAAMMGKVNFAGLADFPLLAVPVPFKFGFSFDLAVFIPIGLIFLITALETTGDLTANSMLSKLPVSGPEYIKRIRAGVLADGINSGIAATFNSLPMTTFSQNNGVIQLTGVASRYVAYYMAAILVLLGLFPAVGAMLQLLPKPVLGGATVVMFGTVAAAGVKILAESKLGRRDMLIFAVSIGLGMGVAGVPAAFSGFPEIIRNIFGSPVTIGAFSAIILSLVLPPEEPSIEEVAEAESPTTSAPATQQAALSSS
ncbi:nucleobase:cation symporter-2 family protein [Balneatrix alpica]|uniref:nucleobase:cation symporter-2 family protein n=1 Tax=Balneatrix alpica TaxID=75684 RepID=UPI002738F813|nr:nucleobase:cation symporter-2 family protein [Balneatrix alpica]